MGIKKALSGFVMELILSGVVWEGILEQNPCEWAGFSQKEGGWEGVHNKSKGSKAGERGEWEEQ